MRRAVRSIWRAALTWLRTPAPLTPRFVALLAVIGTAAFVPLPGWSPWGSAWPE